MPRGRIQPVEFNNLSGGLNTEASPLNFPANATLDEQNYDILKDGTRRRRKGLQRELGGVNLSMTSGAENPYTGSSVKTGTYLWKNVGGSSRIYSIIRIGKMLKIINGTSATPSTEIIDEIEMTYAESDSDITVASLNGTLLISNGSRHIEVLYVFPPNYELIVRTSFNLTSRDVWGTNSGLDINVRPTSLTTRAEYNLYNTGWPKTAEAFLDQDGADSELKSTLSHINASIGTYPAENDVHYTFKSINAEDVEAVGAYNPWSLRKIFYGSSEPTRGSYILDIFARGSSRRSQSGLSGLDDDVTYGGVISLASYAGRVFYGIRVDGTDDTDNRSPDLSSLVFFSRSGVTNVRDYGKCYSYNDPTVEDLNSPLDTDGGFVNISGMGKLVGMETLGNSLFIFADNGVWEISGGERSFSATNLSISRTSSLGTIAPRSIVAAEDGIYYWTQGGIYSIRIDPVSLQGSVTNLTEQKIQSLFLDIPFVQRASSVGTFLNGSRQLRWLYAESSLPNPGMYNKELIYDLDFEAFSIYDFAESPASEDPYIMGYLVPPNTTIEAFQNDVTVNGDQVQVAGDDVIVTLDSEGTNTAAGIQYITVFRDLSDTSSCEFTVSTLRNEDFLDWYEFDNTGVDAKGYLLTGALTAGDGQREKQSVWVTTHMTLTDNIITLDSGAYDAVNPSSCFMRGRWDWTTSADTGRWTAPQQIYRLARLKLIPDSSTALDYGYELVSVRSKIRGSGKALSIYFETEEQKDCHLVGWGLNLTGNNFT